jgi:hypothetical protein
LFRRFSAIIAIVVLTTLIARPSFSDDVTINLDSTTPYVDVPVTITEPVDAVIQTVTGTPQTNPGFIDSWIEVWQGAFKLRADDDGAHSATNVLASIIRMPLTAGEYFILATSFAYMASNGTQFPNGSYLLSTNLTVATPSPSPTVTEVTPEPSPSPTETLTPTPSPSETSTLQPSPEPSPTPSETQSQPENLPGPESSPEVQPSPESLPTLPVEEPQEFVVPTEPDVLVLPVEDLTFNDFPSSLENDLPSLEEEVSQDVFAIDEILSLLSFLPEVSLESLQETFQQISESIGAALESVPGGEQVLAAIQSINNLGSEYTPEEREQVQQVVLGAIIVSQLANPRRVK